MSYFLTRYVEGISVQAFFDRFGLDPILWAVPHRPDPSAGDYSDVLIRYDPLQGSVSADEYIRFLESRRISSDRWRVEQDKTTDRGYDTTRYHFVTPKGTLTMVLQSNEHTTWVTERLIKHRHDIDLIAEFATAPMCDVEGLNRAAAEVGCRTYPSALIRDGCTHPHGCTHPR